MSVERRPQPSAPRRLPRGGRRIADLEKHDAAHITPQAFADYLGVHRKTVIRWIKWGRLAGYHFPSITAGGRAEGEWRIKTSDARAFMRRYKFVPATPVDSAPDREAM